MISNKRRRHLLASSIALALMVGVPATSLAVTFEGVKFNDLNGNGAQDPGEKGLAFETIFFRHSGMSMVTTDANGFYSTGISMTAPTNITLWTGIPDGHQQTTPAKGEGMVTYDVSAQPNDKLTVNFGIWDGIERVDDPDKLIVDAGLNQTVDAGDRAYINGSFTDTQKSDKHNVQVEFGDGNRVDKVVSTDTASLRLRRVRNGKDTTGKVDAKNTFQEAGTYKNTVTVTNAQGQTGTDTTTITVKDVAKSDPCATGIANVQTTKSGAWTDPNTWSPVGVPDKDDWVMIQSVHTVTMPKDMTASGDDRATITGLCVRGTLQSADNSLGSAPTWITLYPKTLRNQGTIQGKNGVPGSGPWCKKDKYQHATGGSSIFLGFPTKFINDGKIQAGNGAIDSTWRSMNDGCGAGTPAKGGHGGRVEVNAAVFQNNGPDGLMKAGDGGFADRVGSWAVHGQGIGGNGGDITVTATNMEKSQNAGRIESGRGGSAEVYINGTNGRAGKGGDTMVMLANQEGVVKGHNGSTIRIDPTTLKFGPKTRISGGDEVNIYGGEDWRMEVTDLQEGAITALKQITFAVGQGGVIDFRGSAPNAIKAGACHVNSLDVVYILDSSKSMEKKLNDGQKRIDAAKQAIIALNKSLSEHNDNHRVALITFDSKARLLSEFSHDLNSVSQTLSDLRLRYYTRLHKGVNAATDLLSNRQNTDNPPVVILFSDGKTPESQARTSLDSLKETVPDIMIHSVGIGDSAATSVLQYAVQVGSGHYYAANDTESLTTALQEAVTETVCPDNDNAEVRIFADEVLLDEGMSLETLINAPNIVQGPAKILYNAAWSGVGYLEDDPGVTLVIPLTLFNGGPVQDTYAINVSDSAGWKLGDLPETVRVNGLRRTELELLVTLPNTHGAQNVVTVTATSQSDSSVVASQDIQIGVMPKSDNGGSEPNEPMETLSTSGVLRDRFQQPIIGALVQIGEKVAITDNAGHWQIDGLAEGDHPVTVTKEGYSFKTENCNIGPDQPCAPKLKATSELAVTVSSESRTLAQGDDLTYLITVTNNGSQTATDIALFDVLPKEVELVSLESLEGGTCDTNAVACNLPNLSPGDSTQAKLVIKSSQANKLANTVEVSSNEYPSDIVKTWVTVTPYLSVSISDSPDPVAMQGTVNYRFDVELSPSALTDATNVELVVQLPTGVELRSINTDQGICDTSNLPTVTCSLNDLSVNSADSISHITVDMAVDLIDPGLLLLTTEAEVGADEYPTHSDRERTKIFIDPNVKVDMVFVIDDSNSMQQEIDDITNALKQFIATVDANTAPFIALVTFKDQVTVRAASRDMTVLLNAIEALKASGGGMCQEASAEALEIAIKHLKDGGSILLATDASPYHDADIEGLVALLRNKTMKLNTLLTGDCANKDSWNGVNDE
jgi:uncharacterized repeat protein (TIGR01451 family)